MSTATVPAVARAGRPARVRGGDAVVVPMSRYRDVRPAHPEEPPPLRLTPRGRRVLHALGVLLLLVVAVGGALVARTAEAGTGSGPAVAERVVLPGETLWQIAGEVAPGVDRRETVAQLVDLNGLDSSRVEAGRRIAVPVYSDGR